MKGQSFHFGKNKKNISKCRLLKFLPSMLSITSTLSISGLINPLGNKQTKKKKQKKKKNKKNKQTKKQQQKTKKTKNKKNPKKQQQQQQKNNNKKKNSNTSIKINVSIIMHGFKQPWKGSLLYY